MSDYDLTRLGPTEFEHMAQALVARYFGPSIRIYGAGRDGGREATADGAIVLPDGISWSGYTVAQAKFRLRPETPASNAEWLRNEVRKELGAWTDEKKNRSPKPANLLFITNVALSAVPGHGVDSVNAVFADFHEKLPLNGYAFWHYEHICRLLDDNPGIRTAFAGLITPGDVLAELHRILVGQAANLGGIMRRHAAKELLAEQWVRLGQSGSRNNEKLPLGRVAVDLAVDRSAPTRSKSRVPAVAHVLELGNQVLRPSIRKGPPPHLVLVGGPGQGKTTVSQLMCQAYRVALVEEPDNLGPQAASVVRTVRDHLRESGLPIPATKRWPLRVELSRFADVLAGAEGTSLLRYISDRISERTDETVAPGQLRSWLEAWPWLLVLDGFDEVAAPHVREALVQRVSEFLIDAETVDADLLLVATTRPRGYSGEFTPDHYDHLTLSDLSPEEALAYARKLADVRHADDPDVHRNVLDRIAEAAEEDLTARLMRTPLQVTIMSLLLEGRARVPQQRYGLFDAYFETIYNRETAKATPTARLLDQHRKIVNSLHERVGLSLQVQAEEQGHSDPALSQESLRELAYEWLIAEEYESTEASELASKVVTAATDRLVLLVPKNKADVGFEVRSLQEFMAARAIVTGEDDEVLARLQVLAPSAHWRNTWLLAAGRIATMRDHLVNRLILVLDQVDTQDYLMLQLVPGAELAVDLLYDGFAASSRRVERLLLRRAVELLRRPLDSTTALTARALQTISSEGSAGVARVISDAAKQALAGEPPQKVTAAVMMWRWHGSTGPLAALGRQRVPHLRTALTASEYHAFASLFIRNINVGPGHRPRPSGRLTDRLTDVSREGFDSQDDEAFAVLLEAFNEVYLGIIEIEEPSERILTVPFFPPPDPTVLGVAFGRTVVADAIADWILRLPSEDWPLASAVTDLARRWLQHRPVGKRLLVDRAN